MECPLCKSLDLDFLSSVPVSVLVKAWKKDFGIDIQSLLENIQTIQLFACQSCHLQHFVPYDLAGTAAFYATLDKFDWYYMPRKWEHDLALLDLKGSQTVVDVGCGKGDFVARMKENGIVFAEGIELNENAVQIAQSHGWPVRRIDLADLAVERAGQYDAVCSFQVLEHVSAPRDFLQGLTALLRPGGKLVIGVPNACSYLRFQFNLLDMPPHHLTRWSPAILTRLPEYFPYRLIRLEREPLADYHVPDYVASCLHRFAGPLNRQPSRILAAWFIRHTGLRKRLIGHTVYAAYERI